MSPLSSDVHEEIVAQFKGYDLHPSTRRDVRMTKTRTITNWYLIDSLPDNGIIHTQDAKRLRFKTGDQGKVQVTETIRPGVITFTLGHRHQ